MCIFCMVLCQYGSMVLWQKGKIMKLIDGQELTDELFAEWIQDAENGMAGYDLQVVDTQNFCG